MKVVSPFLKKTVYPALSQAGVFRRSAGSGLAVVTYHGVLPEAYEPVDSGFDGNLVTTEMFRRQLRLLKSHYNVVAPEDFLAWREGRHELPLRAVLLTCDDGLVNCLTDMLPVLQQEEVRCLFFVTGASAGHGRTMLWYEELFLIFFRAQSGPFEISFSGIEIRGELHSPAERRAIWWRAVQRLSQIDRETRESFLGVARRQLGIDLRPDFAARNSPACRRLGLLTADELGKLSDAGMTIGAHTSSHPVLSQMPAEMAEVEIAESKSALESALQIPVWALAYPFGDPQSVNSQVLAMAEAAGFQAAFLNYGGGLGADLPPFAMPRIHVTADMSPAELEAHVSGFYGRMRKRAGRNSAFVLRTSASRQS
jgi:peptidoglycan/xylan/chitin deacetylase (PgdA/CDA1 family)